MVSSVAAPDRIKFVAKGEGAWLFMPRFRHPEVLLEGPRGCVAGETELWDPIAGEGRRIDELCWSRTRPWVLTHEGPVLADVPFLKGYAPLFRVTLESGQSCLVTADHLFESRAGWSRVDSLAVGMELRSSSLVDAHRLRGTGAGSRCDCRRCRRLCDRRLLGESVDGQGVLPLGGDARGSSRDDLRGDDRGEGRASSRPYLSVGHPSTLDCSVLSSPSRGGQRRVSSGRRERGGDWSRFDGQSPSEGSVEGRVQELGRDSVGMHSCRYGTSQWGPIQEIRYERTDFYYDLHVPGPEHYLADGMWSHNTGKSRLMGELFFRLLNEYPGVRILVVRKTRVSMNETFLKTWESDVLPRPDWDKEIARISRRVREKYQFANGSELLVAGMDQERLLGSEVDIVAVDEAVQFREVELANLTPLLRNHKLPWQMLICATNPAGQNHWLNKRPEKGRMVRLRSRHEDNARYDVDPKFKEQYMQTLHGLPPSLRKRWLDGDWVTQEGLVYPDWDPEIHIKDRKQVPPLRGYFGSIDWGYTPSPGVMQVWGKDDLDRLWLVAEVYKRKKHIDWWASRIAELDEEFELERIVCDSAEPRSIDDLNKHLGPRRGRHVGALAIKAEKAWETGHRKMCWYLSTDDRGPRMFVVEGATRYGPDEELADEGRPTGFVQEMDEAVWAEAGSDGVAPDKVDKRCAVHALDSGRYACMWADGKKLRRTSKRGLEKLGPEALLMYKDLGPKWFWRYVKGLPGGWQGLPKDYKE